LFEVPKLHSPLSLFPLVSFAEPTIHAKSTNASVVFIVTTIGNSSGSLLSLSLSASTKGRFFFFDCLRAALTTPTATAEKVGFYNCVRRLVALSFFPHGGETKSFFFASLSYHKKVQTMPNVIVTCVFNPPTISIQGTSIRQDTIEALQRALPKQTTTSLPSQRPGESAKFLLTNGDSNGAENVSPHGTAGRIEGGAGADGHDNQNDLAAAKGDGNNEGYKSWRIDLGQHYCDQKGRSMIFLVIMEALEEEGFALRGTHTVVTEKEKDVTRLIFARA
jgi:hypothetical protein